MPYYTDHEFEADTLNGTVTGAATFAYEIETSGPYAPKSDAYISGVKFVNFRLGNLNLCNLQAPFVFGREALALLEREVEQTLTDRLIAGTLGMEPAPIAAE